MSAGNSSHSLIAFDHFCYGVAQHQWGFRGVHWFQAFRELFEIFIWLTVSWISSLCTTDLPGQETFLLLPCTVCWEGLYKSFTPPYDIHTYNRELMDLPFALYPSQKPPVTKERHCAGASYRTPLRPFIFLWFCIWIHVSLLFILFFVTFVLNDTAFSTSKRICCQFCKHQTARDSALLANWWSEQCSAPNAVWENLTSQTGKCFTGTLPTRCHHCDRKWLSNTLSVC